MILTLKKAITTIPAATLAITHVSHCHTAIVYEYLIKSYNCAVFVTVENSSIAKQIGYVISAIC